MSRRANCDTAVVTVTVLAPIIDATSIASKIRDDFIVVILIAPIIIVMTLHVAIMRNTEKLDKGTD